VTTKSKKAESGILASAYKTAAGLHHVGLVDNATIREFDALCHAHRAPDAWCNPR
jgi:putative transcriptional regulator